MGKLKPIGSEKLQGADKINRMLEIAKYKETKPNPINENTSIDYSKRLADGNKYHIIKEKNGYVIKKSLNESVSMDYIEPMKNRKYYSSYSQAFKRLNLIAKEVNINEGCDNNVNLFEGDVDDKAATKYILNFGGEKNEQAAPSPTPVPAQPQAPAPVPAPETPSEPMDEPMAEPSPEESDIETDVDMDTEEDDDEVITFKTIQKLTGRLAQKIRTLNDNADQQMTSKDIKYVINSILSAINLTILEEEDLEDIINKLEGDGEDELGGMEGGEEDVEMDVDMDVEEPAEPSPEPEGEMSEKINPKQFVDNIFKDLEENQNLETRESAHQKKVGDMIEGIFTESKIDDILKKYFSINENEKKQIKLKQTQILENKKNTFNQVKTISETVSQEIMAKKLVSKYPQAKLIGKTKSKNLVFEIKNKQIKVSPNGQIL
jgi:hypothetical protein